MITVLLVIMYYMMKKSGIVAISFDVFESFEFLRKCSTYKFDRRRVTTDLNY